MSISVVSNSIPFRAEEKASTDDIKKAEEDVRINKIGLILFGTLAALACVALVGVLGAWAIVPLAASQGIGLSISAGIITGATLIPVAGYAWRYKKAKKALATLQ